MIYRSDCLWVQFELWLRFVEWLGKLLEKSICSRLWIMIGGNDWKHNAIFVKKHVMGERKIVVGNRGRFAGTTCLRIILQLLVNVANEPCHQFLAELVCYCTDQNLRILLSGDTHKMNMIHIPWSIWSVPKLHRIFWSLSSCKVWVFLCGIHLYF